MLIYRPTIISGSGYYSGSFDGDGSRLYNIPSSSYAITASYALNGGGGNPVTPFRIATGSISASVDIGTTLFLIKSASTDILSIDNTGIITLITQSIELSTPAPNGGIYFTSNSFYVGLD
jgi:hypothetical protein